MLTLDNLREQDIKSVLSSKSWSRAKKLLHAVHNPQRRGNELSGDVHGSQVYAVTVQVDKSIHATCTCSYDWSGYCKHIGAVLLTWVRTPSHFHVVEQKTTTTDDVIPSNLPKSRPPKHTPTWMTTTWRKRKQADREQLEKWLNNYRIQDLRTVAKQRGWRLKGTRKADLIKQLIALLTKSTEMPAALTQLSAEDKAVLYALAVMGHPNILRRTHLTELAQHWDASLTDGQVVQVGYDLVQTGLVIDPEAGQVHGYPQTARAVMSALVPALSEIVPVSEPPTTYTILRADPVQLVRIVHQLFALLEQNPPPLRPLPPRPRLEKYHKQLRLWRVDVDEVRQLKAAGELTKRSNVMLTVPPPNFALAEEGMDRLQGLVDSAEKLDFIYHLMLNAGLLQTGSPATVWSTAKINYIQQNELAQQAILARTYFQMVSWHEVWQLLRDSQQLRLQRSWMADHFKPKQLDDHLLAIRQRILRTLACLPDGQWVEVSAIYRLLRPIWKTLNSKSETYTHYYYHHQKTPLWEVTYNGKSAMWNLAQKHVVDHVLRVLHWLGLADVATNNDHITHIALQGLATLYWDQADTIKATVPTPASNSDPIVNNGLKVTLDPAVATGEMHTYLDQIARLVTAQPNQFIYEVDVEAVHATFEAGVTLSTLCETWQSLFAKPMSAVIETQLQTWWDAYGQVRLYAGVTLIEFADEYALAEMQAVTTLADYIIATLSPQLVMIPESAVESLTEQLQQAGYTPKIA